MWRSRWRCVIKPAYSVSFLLSINIFVWQNVLYFPKDLRVSEYYVVNYQLFTSINAKISVSELRREINSWKNGYLSQRHCASSVCGWRVAAHILNKQSRTADKGWFSSFRVGRGAENSSPLKTGLDAKHSERSRTWTEPLVRPEQWIQDMRFRTSSGNGMWGMDWIDLAQDRDRWRPLVNKLMKLRVP